MSFFLSFRWKFSKILGKVDLNRSYSPNNLFNKNGIPVYQPPSKWLAPFSCKDLIIVPYTCSTHTLSTLLHRKWYSIMKHNFNSSNQIQPIQLTLFCVLCHISYHNSKLFQTLISILIEFSIQFTNSILMLIQPLSFV